MSAPSVREGQTSPDARGIGEDGHVDRPDMPKPENAAVRERVSMLSAAILRTGASDLGTELKEVVADARALPPSIA